MAPMKEIAVKLYRNWQHRFGRLEDISVALLTGDLQYDQKLLVLAKIVVTDATKFYFLHFIRILWLNFKVLD